MTYEEYAGQKKKFGQWPRSKEDIYRDAKNIAIEQAAKAIGMRADTLNAMIEGMRK